MRFAVVGGGLAGLAAALELVDAGHDVTLYEARQTLGGAVQTLPEREGDPAPPPDNGQHIALGACEEYVGFLRRIGREGDLLRVPLALPVIDERGRVATIRPVLRALLRYSHVSLRDRLRILRLLARPPRLLSDERTFADFLRAHGQSDTAIDRFWDVFMRPALNLRSEEADASVGWFTVTTALLSGKRASDLLVPTAPLGEMHGDAAERALEAAGAAIRTGVRVDSLDDLDVDGVVVAVPPADAARLLGEPEPALESSPIVSVHLLFDRHILRHELAALLGSPAHWVFDRGALTGHVRGTVPRGVRNGQHDGSTMRRDRPHGTPEGTVPQTCQYLTVVSSGAPELMEVRGRALVELMAGELTARLGEAELLWSRVSREPAATIALRPGVRRPEPGDVRAGVARAGAWTDTGWPVTMEGAIRSGHAAARALQGVREEVHA
jgi:squalene-associated FAD-dependent desaturase